MSHLKDYNIQALEKEALEALDLVKLHPMSEEQTQELLHKITHTIDYVHFLTDIPTQDVISTYSPSVYWDKDWIVSLDEDIPETMNKEEILRNAPKRTLDFFVVPKVIDHE